MKMYDAIVIGGGIGGCGTASLLSVRGFKVLLLDKGTLIGGRCSSYEKDGFKLPTYIHAFARVDKGPCGDLARIIGEPLEWGRERVALFKMKDKEVHATIGGGLSNFKTFRSLNLPPKEFLKLGQLALDVGLKRNRWETEFDDMDIQSWLNRFTDNETIHTLMAFISTASFVVPYWKCSAGEFLHILKNMHQAGAAGYPMQECGAIAEAYLKGFLKAGGEYRREKVEKIIVWDNQARGVVLGNGEELKSKVVISNTGVKPTILDLVGGKYFDSAYLDKISRLEHSWSAVVVKIAVDKKISDLKASMYMPSYDPQSYFSQVEAGEVPDDLALWITIPSNISPSLAPPGKQLICAGSPMPYQKKADWGKWIESCTATMKRLFPDIDKYAMWQDNITPANIDSMGAKDGTVIGLAQSVGQVGRNRPSIQSPITGLFHAGSDVGSRAIGVELAAESAIRCAKEVELQLV